MYKINRKYHFIYKTINLVNKRYYYGMHSTDNLDDNYLGSGYALWKSIRKYGKQNFKREIIEFCKDREELVAKEKEIVSLNEIAKKDCMNLKPGGTGGFMSEEHMIKCGKAGNDGFRKKLREDAEFAAKWSNIVTERNIKLKLQPICNWNGRKHKPETIEKIRNKRKLQSSHGKINE